MPIMEQGVQQAEDLLQMSSNAVGQEKQDVSPVIMELEKDITPLVTLTAKTEKKKTDTYRFFWDEEDLFNWRLRTINFGAGYDAVVTTFVVDDASAFIPGMMFKVPRTGELMRVSTSTVSTNTIVVTARGFAGTTPAALVNTDPLIIYSASIAQGGNALSILQTKPVERIGYIQSLSTTYGVDDTVNSENVIGGNPLKRAEYKAAKMHKLLWEQTFWHGKNSGNSAIDPLNANKKLTTTDGLLDLLEASGSGTPIMNLNSNPLTEPELEEFCEMIGRYGDNRKFFFIAPVLATFINSFARDKVRIVKDTSTYGISVKRLEMWRVTLDIIVHNNLEGAVYGGYGVAVDANNLAYRYLHGSNGSQDTHLLTNRQQPNAHETINEYFTQAGFQVSLLKTHGILKGVKRV